MGDDLLAHLLKKYDEKPEGVPMKILKSIRAEDFVRFPPPQQCMTMQDTIHELYTDTSVVQALGSDPNVLLRLKQRMSGRMLPYAKNNRKQSGDLVHYFDHVWVLIGERLVLFRQDNNALIPVHYCGRQIDDGHQEYIVFLNQLDARWREFRHVSVNNQATSQSFSAIDIMGRNLLMCITLLVCCPALFAKGGSSGGGGSGAGSRRSSASRSSSVSRPATSLGLTIMRAEGCRS